MRSQRRSRPPLPQATASWRAVREGQMNGLSGPIIYQ